MMIPIKTTKVLFLTLLFSFTASIAAEGWTEWLKSKIITKNVAIASSVGIVATCSFYYWWTKPRLTQTLTFVGEGDKQDEVVDVAGLGMKLSNHTDLRVSLAFAEESDGVHDDSEHQCLLINDDSNAVLATFAPQFRLNDDKANGEAYIEDERVSVLLPGREAIMLRRSDTQSAALFSRLYIVKSPSRLHQEYTDYLANGGDNLDAGGVTKRLEFMRNTHNRVPMTYNRDQKPALFIH